MEKYHRALASLLCFLLLAPLSVFAESVWAGREGPKLILQITVDQLRGDQLDRFYGRFQKRGFRYLLDRGVVFTDAHHPHANTETIVGHTTLATGAYPSAHGMISNMWFDRTTGDITYNIEDDRYHLLTEGADVDDKSEIDPTQRAARSEGRSPARIMVSTFSDELATYTAGKAKIFGVSVKDRGAVSMAGHAGKAFWFSKGSGTFVTSSYYYKSYPEWVTRWNKEGQLSDYEGEKWELQDDQEQYLFGDRDDQEWEVDLAGFGKTFPHPYGRSDSKYFTTLLTISPAGDALTADFAKKLIVEEELGQDDVPDYLSISFSSTDYVGHIFGPSSLEAEDNLLRLDGEIAELLELVDDEVGLKNTLIVLSADHGGPDAPGYLNALGIPGGYVDPDSWDKEASIKRLKSRFGISGKLIERYSPPYLYLSSAVRSKSKADRQRIEDAIVEEVGRYEGVALAVSSSALARGGLPDTPLYRSVLRNFSPTRSGDVYVVFKPNWFINDFDGLEVSSTHGSPWRYDTHVPIVFAGAGVQPNKVFRRVRTTDVATTLSMYIGTNRPSGAAGGGLVEVFRR